MIPLLVLGGGIGGMATALALARNGVRVHLLERAPAFGEIGAGIQLAPNALKALDRLGVLAAVMEHAVFPRRLVLLDIYSEKELTSLDVGDKFIVRYKYPYIVIHRNDLLQALLDGCRASDRVTLDTNKNVVDVQDLQHSARLQCEDGTSYECGALIAADGLWSTVRRRLFADDQPPHCPGYVAYRGTISIKEVPQFEGRDNVLIYAGANMHLVQYPVHGGELYNQVAVFRSDRFRPERALSDDWGTVEELDEHFLQAGPRIRDAMTKIGRGRRWPLFDRAPTIHWARNNVVLTGDAAHPMLQFLAQGACQALEDAVCLADLLPRYPNDPAKAFVLFQNTRFVPTARVQQTARFFEHFWHPHGVSAAVRDEYLAHRAPDDYRHLDWVYGS
jgi:2-polyprenyl-6-methoxyphenol hydroxylase-like FAD-dependent oxidoreductase